VLVFFMINWFIVSYSLVFLAVCSSFPKYLFASFTFIFKPTLQTKKKSLIVMCTLHFIGREHENLGKRMIVYVTGMSLE